MNRIDQIINQADQSVLQRELENAQLLERHFTEQKATLLRRSIPRCENEDRNGKACDGEAVGVCVHCEQALCVIGGCFDDVCSVAHDGKHVSAKDAIETALEKLVQSKRMDSDLPVLQPITRKVQSLNPEAWE